MTDVVYKPTSQVNEKYIKELQAELDKLKIEKAVATTPVLTNLGKTEDAVETIANAQNINNLATLTYSFDVTGERQIRYCFFEYFASGSALSAVEIRANGKTIFQINAIAFPLGAANSGIYPVDILAGLRESGTITYQVRITNNSGNNWNYTFYLHRATAELDTIPY